MAMTFEYYTSEGQLARIDPATFKKAIMQRDGTWFPYQPDPDGLMGPISEERARSLAGSHSLTAPPISPFGRRSVMPFEYYTDEGQLARIDPATGEQAILQPGGAWYPYPSRRLSPITEQRARKLAEGHSLTAPTREPYTAEQSAEFRRTGDPAALHANDPPSALRPEGDQR
jgi:hypothetical protein